MTEQSRKILEAFALHAGLSVPEDRLPALEAARLAAQAASSALFALDLSRFEPAARFRPPPPAR
jgi:hypothetical protein